MAEREGGGWDVFLAYASPDGARARELHDALRALGLSVCFDQEALRPGDNWHAALPRHIRDSTVVVALVSDHTSEAHYQNSEIVRAVEQLRREGGRLVPVRLGPGVDLPYGTEQLQAIDLFDGSATPAVAERVAEVVRNPASVLPLRPIPVFAEWAPAPPPFFAGRDALVAELGRGLGLGEAGEARSATVPTQAISGMGGIGKSTIAAALVEAHRDELDIVWWVRAEQPAVMAADLAALAKRLGLAGDGGDEGDQLADTLRGWLETTERRWLLVFDNALDEASIEPWRPKRGRGAVVITSRNRNFGRVGTVVEVATFPPDVAEQFLRDRVARRNPAAAAGDEVRAVVERLDGLPLALEQAAAWIERVPNRTFARYAELFDDAAADPFPDGPGPRGDTRPLGYEHTATTAWRVSVEAAEAEAPRAGRLLAALSFVAPDDLPCAWLRERAADPYLDGPADDQADGDDGRDATTVDAALAALHDYSLATITAADTIGVHRVVRAVTWRAAPPDAAGFAVRLLAAHLPADLEDRAGRATMATLTPHGLALATTTRDRLHSDLPARQGVLNAVVEHQLNVAPPPVARATAQDVAALAEAHLPTGDPIALESRRLLADTHLESSELDGLAERYEAVLTDAERALGADHPVTLRCRGALAHVLMGLGGANLYRGRDMMEATVAAQTRHLGADHPDTLRSRHRLATVHDTLGDIQSARAMFEATLADMDRVLGPDHPASLATRNNLAVNYIQGGSLDDGIALLADLRDRFERHYGPDNQYTFDSRANLAIAHSRAGRHREAMAMLEEVLADAERVLGSDSVPAANIRRDLANVYTAAGQPHQAVPLLEDVVSVYEQDLGPDLPATYNAGAELAVATRAAAFLPGPTTAGERLGALVVGAWVFGLGVAPDTVGPGGPAAVALAGVVAGVVVAGIGAICARAGLDRLLHGLCLVTVRGWSAGAALGLVAAPFAGNAGMVPALALHILLSLVVFTVLQLLRGTHPSQLGITPP